MLIAFVVGWGLRQLGVAATAASLWAFSFSLMPGVAALLSGSQADLLRAVWPREAVDWLAWASLLFTGVAVVQFRGYQRRWHWTTVVLGLLLGIGVVCGCSMAVSTCDRSNILASAARDLRNWQFVGIGMVGRCDQTNGSLVAGMFGHLYLDSRYLGYTAMSGSLQYVSSAD